MAQTQEQLQPQAQAQAQAQQEGLNGAQQEVRAAELQTGESRADGNLKYHDRSLSRRPAFVLAQQVRRL